MAMPSRNNSKEDPSPAEPQPPPPPPSSSSSVSSSAADNFSPAPRKKPPTFPPGYKFVPTEEDLIVHYLKPFLRHNKSLPPNVPIHRVNIYESNPERLSKEYVKGNDKEWFFITERTKMHEGGNKNKHSRCDNGGFWKGRAALEEFKTRKGVAFSRMVFDHYTGTNQKGVKSGWVMYEYLTESSPRDKSNSDNKTDYALCKIYMTPSGIKRKAKEEEIEKKKEGDEEASQEVDQPCNQQTHPPESRPCTSDMFCELNTHDIPDDVDGSIDLSPLYEDRESKKD